MLSLATFADEYQFIISGYPVANVNYAAESAATSLVTGSLAAPTHASALEARYRTRDMSVGTALRSDKYHGFVVVFK